MHLKSWLLHALISDWAWAQVSFKDGSKDEEHSSVNMGLENKQIQMWSSPMLVESLEVT